ncbi:MAG: TlpA disulfide reductase family protein [bacterium]
MKNILKYGFLTLLLFIIAVGCTKTPNVEGESTPKPSSEKGLAPDFTLEDLEGNEITLSELRGAVIILDFWATWCPPCRDEIPGFIKLYDKYNEKGLEIIGISVDKGSDGQLIKFAEEWNMNYPIVRSTNDVNKAYGGIRAIPTTFIIDKKGKIRNKHIGFASYETFEEEVLELLNEE